MGQQQIFVDLYLFIMCQFILLMRYFYSDLLEVEEKSGTTKVSVILSLTGTECLFYQDKRHRTTAIPRPRC